MSTQVPPQAQAFELGMHAALKAAGVKTAADAEAFFKLADAHMTYEVTEQARREAFEVGTRGALSDEGIKTAEAQDAVIKEALDIQELLGKAKGTGADVLDKTKQVGSAVAGAARLGIAKVKEKGPAVAGGLREFIKRKLKTLGIG